MQKVEKNTLFSNKSSNFVSRNLIQKGNEKTNYTTNRDTCTDNDGRLAIISCCIEKC